jgi:hypothetical protein
MLKQIRQRSSRLRKNVVEAERRGMTRELIKAEFAPNFGSIYNNRLILEEELDAKTNKTIKS